MTFRYDPTDTFIIFGTKRRCTHQTEAVCVFDAEDPKQGPSITLSHREIGFLRGSNNWRYIPGSGTLERLRRTAKTGIKGLRHAHPDDQDAAIFAFMECMALKAFHEAGTVTLTPASLRKHWPQILQEFSAQEAVRNLGDGPRRGGSKLPQQRRPHSPETLLRLYRKLRKGNYDPSSLLPRYRKQRVGGKTFCAETEDFIRDHIKASINREGLGASEIAQDTRKALIQENQRRAENGERLLGVPSERTIERRIELLDPFEVAVLRHGVDKARMEFATPSGGLDVLYPLERVEIDEWEGDVRTLFKQLGILNELPIDMREQVPSGRRYVYAAIDCATRCMVGLVVCATPNADAARRVIGQILKDKTEIARAAGAEGSWEFFGTPHLICTDTGSAFRANMFVVAVNTLGSIMLFPPVKIPELRSRVERLFGTMARQIMPRLPGRTFDSPKARGDYLSEERTVLSDEDLTRILTIWAVDHYHHQPHSGLPGAQSPASRWRELAAKYDVTEPPDLNTRRVALGYEFERKPSKQGVVLFSNYYNCPELIKYWRTNKGKPVQVRIDPENIGAVSVEIGREWFQATALNGETLENLSLAEWRLAMRELRQRYAGEALVTLPQRDRAIEKIKNIVGEACERAGLIDPGYSAEHLEYLEKNLCAGLLFDHPSEPPVSDEDVPFGRKITPSTSVQGRPLSGKTDNTPDTDNGEPDWKLED